MKRIGILVAVVFAVTGYAGVARAQTNAPMCAPSTAPCTFVTVDSVSVYYNRIYVTGVPEGGSVPVERYAFFPISTSGTDTPAGCQRLALMAMAKPGQYVLRLTYVSSTAGHECRLTRVTP